MERESKACESSCKNGNHDEAMHDRFRLELHTKALGYYDKFKSLCQNAWSDATDYARKIYKKYEDTLSTAYKDIMKYIMLVSDQEVQEQLEL